MTPEQRRRAGDAVAQRITEMRSSIPAVARKAGVDPTTVRSLVRGARWPNTSSRLRIADALEWPPGEIARRALVDVSDLAAYTTGELLAELTRRADRNTF